MTEEADDYDLHPIATWYDHAQPFALNAYTEITLTLLPFPLHGMEGLPDDMYDLPEPLRFMEWQMREHYRAKLVGPDEEPDDEVPPF